MYKPSASHITSHAPKEGNHVAGYGGHDIGHCEISKKEGFYGEEAEVDYVGQGSLCHRCGGAGHWQKCATPKGKRVGQGKGKRKSM